MRQFVTALVFFICLIGKTYAEPIMKKQNGAVYVENITTAEVEKLFRQNLYSEYNIPYGKYPRIYLNKMPTDWKDIPENKAKHRTFIRILLPLVLKVNEEISVERTLIENINDKFHNNIDLSDKDLQILEDKAAKYDVFTRMKGKERTAILLKQLLDKIDILPPSIMIASAAIYTDWGTSRLALTANSLYLDEIWYQNEGLKPLDDDGADYRYKVYNSLEESIEAHALELNSSVNYDYLRAARAMNRKIDRPPFGEQMTVHLLFDNNMQNILGLIDYTMMHYNLNKTDYYPQLKDAK